MKLAGLNNLATLKPQSNAPSKSTSGKDPKGSSFEDVLGQTKSTREERAPIARDERRADERRTDLRASQDRAPQAKVSPQERAPISGQVRPQADAKRETPNTNERQFEPKQNADASRATGPGTGRPASELGEVQAESADVEATGLDGISMPSQGMPNGIATPVSDRLPNQALVMGQPLNKAAMLPAKGEDGADSLTRRVVWNDFLRKMKEEFGVSAEDVLQAFGSLSEEDLAKPPTETVDKVVMALGLNDSQAVSAKQYFQDLIQKTQSRSMGEELATSGKQINLSLMSERELQRKNMERSLQQMNSSFFLNGPNARAMQTPNMETSAQPLNTKIASSEDGTLAALTPDLNAAAPLSVPSVAGLTQTPAANPAMPQAAAQNQRMLNELTAQMQPVEAGKEKSVDQLVQKFMQGQAPMAKHAATPAAAAPAVGTTAGFAAPAAAQAEPSISAGAMNSLLAALGGGDDTASTDEDGGEFSDASYLNAPISDLNTKLNAPLNTANDFQTQLGQVKPGAPMAPADMVQQAQIMVRDGGGEMKVTMSPEGLGEVAMRVSVDNGKVNVQMITESDEAKKMLERSLGELKTQLSHNNLQVADIKVDTATNLGKQMEQQYQDAQRQQTQAQWEQFRQDTGGWKRNPFETASVREYKGQGLRDRNAPAMADVSAASKRNGARRLNLVA